VSTTEQSAVEGSRRGPKPRKERPAGVGNDGRGYKPIRGEKPRRWSVTNARERTVRSVTVSSKRVDAAWEREHQGGNERGDTPRLQVGNPSRGMSNVARKPSMACSAAYRPEQSGRCGVPKNTQGEAKAAETRRTPGSVAGCNKPASPAVGKPARSCETARSERDCEVGTS